MQNPPPAVEVIDYAAPGRAVGRSPRPPVVRIVVFGLVLFPLVVLAAYSVARGLPIGWTTIAVAQEPKA